MTRAARADSVIADFFAHTVTPSQAQLDYLVRRNGVPNMALAYDGDLCGFVVGAAAVAFGQRLFDFAEPGAAAHTALVVVARDRAGAPRDLVAWSPREDRAAAYLGRVVLLGEHDLDAPRADSPLRVHRGFLGWLKAQRLGVVVLNKSRAWRTLDGVKVAAEDIEHGLELRSLLTSPPPSIVVPSPSGAQPRAAA